MKHRRAMSTAPTHFSDAGELTSSISGARGRVPQRIGEHLLTKYAFRQVLERTAARIVMPDPIWTGGTAGAIKIATLADVHYLPIAPHDCTWPVNVFAC